MARNHGRGEALAGRYRPSRLVDRYFRLALAREAVRDALLAALNRAPVSIPMPLLRKSPLAKLNSWPA